MSRVIVISDMHCGHRAGLTPPDYQMNPNRTKYGKIQKEMWDKYQQAVEKYQPVDLVIHNGDAIDGKGQKSGGTELITADRDEQVSIAADCLRLWKAPKIVLTYGTGYHTGTDEDWEGVLAATLGAEIHSHAFIDVDGVVFDCKHKISSSIVPYGRHTAPSRDWLWNVLWAERGLQPKANVFIRSHVHYFTFAGDAGRICVTTPALQGPSTKFGARMCSGTVDFGLMVFDCNGGEFSWKYENFDLSFMAQEAIKI